MYVPPQNSPPGVEGEDGVNADHAGGLRMTLTTNLGPRAPRQPDQNLLACETSFLPSRAARQGLLPPPLSFRSISLHLSIVSGTSLAVQWLRLCAFTAGGTGSIPGQGTKIPHAAGKHGQKQLIN